MYNRRSSKDVTGELGTDKCGPFLGKRDLLFEGWYFVSYKVLFTLCLATTEIQCRC